MQPTHQAPLLRLSVDFSSAMARPSRDGCTDSWAAIAASRFTRRLLGTSGDDPRPGMLCR
jgi:hypothetical protein